MGPKPSITVSVVVFVCCSREALFRFLLAVLQPTSASQPNSLFLHRLTVERQWNMDLIEKKPESDIAPKTLPNFKQERL